MTETTHPLELQDALFEATVEIWLFIESLTGFLDVVQGEVSEDSPSMSVLRRTIGAFLSSASDALLDPVFALAPELQEPRHRPARASSRREASGGRDHLHVREAVTERLAQEPAPGPFASVSALVRACLHLQRLQAILAKRCGPELAATTAPLAARMTERVAIELGLFELGRLATNPAAVAALRELYRFGNPAIMRPLAPTPAP